MTADELNEVQAITLELEGNPELMQFMKAALDLPPEVVRKVTTSFENGGVNMERLKVALS